MPLSARRPRHHPLVVSIALLGLASFSATVVEAQERRFHSNDSIPQFAHTEGAGKNARTLEEAAPPKAVAIEMTPQLSDNLALLFEKFASAEFVVCLEGDVNEVGMLELRDFRMPHIAYSRSTGTAVHPDGGCEQYEDIVGSLHNHPATYPEDRGVEWTNCYLSRPDILSWLEHTEYPYTFVMCGEQFWAWWHRTQVSTKKVLAFPPTGQLAGRPPNLE